MTDLTPDRFYNFKVTSLSKNPIKPVIEVNDEGKQPLILEDMPSYKSSGISNVRVNSCTFSGCVKLKNRAKKAKLDSMAIPIRNEQEIIAFVKLRI